LKAPISSPSLSSGTLRAVRTCLSHGLMSNTAAYDGCCDMSVICTVCFLATYDGGRFLGVAAVGFPMDTARPLSRLGHPPPDTVLGRLERTKPRGSARWARRTRMARG